MNNKFDKTLFLTKFSIRRDAWKLLAWIIALSGMMTVIAIKFSDIYGSKSSILAIESTLKSTSMVSMFGSFDIPFKTNADVFGAEMLIFMAIMMIVMNIYFSVQGSIGEESKGLTELISSKSVGKLAIIFSWTLEILILNLLVGILFGLGIQFSGMSGVTTEAAWLIALSLAMEVFGMLGLLMAQLADSTRTANILSYLVFGIIYIARIITDLKNPKLTWFNPLEIIEKYLHFMLIIGHLYLLY
ncbi:hypothetical protein [Companilactobacillus metriopterae]|uniref:hypothetical protein n=1 Tax=Companilactobacillus metriopterae TaxID=1909267 RepID=UPI00100B7EC7|nr:hypothetical protein [Companilactobacillus metriopterae]